MSEMVKITIRLPKDLVLLAKMHAMALDDDLQDFVGRELREALERKPFPAALAAMTMKRRGKKGAKR